MKAIKANVIIFLNLSAAANAVQISNKGMTDVSPACAKALTTEIHCHDRVPEMNPNHHQKWVGDVELADKICTNTCADSLRSWNDTVTKDCAEEIDRPGSYLPTGFWLNSVGYWWQCFNETCVKDTHSGRYCQEIIDGFTKPKNFYRHVKTTEELCHPCYEKVLNVFSKSFLWTPNEMAWLYGESTEITYWKVELDLVHQKCGKHNSTVTPVDAPIETMIEEDIQGPTPSGPTDPGIPSDCSFYETINTGIGDCFRFASDWAITLKQFVEYNPTIGKDCSGIQLGHSYCVEVNNGKPRKKGSPEKPQSEEMGVVYADDEKSSSDQEILKGNSR
ncbi:hypothetical protein FLONG3_541 [Fusarium longipes]|uniref:LysM domain-containing protein n=1 Tax=Fusarium longipes TaxID=694270 RepID=A0A395TA62_9HYPO|nr:hypothetical protein FLONG3_541 [Fusarium longipes]